MPPIPTPNKKAAKGRSSPSTPKRERGDSARESSSAPRTAPRSRATKVDGLREQVARMYMVIGTMLVPFGRFYPVLEPIGNNCKTLSSDAADAWIDLAQKDVRVMQALENLTAASTWGNVVGIHLAIFASAVPGAGYVQQVTSVPSDSTNEVTELWRQGRAMGMSDEEIEQAVAQATGTPMPAREREAGGPGDTVRTGGEPVAPVITTPGIVSVEELGVTQRGIDGTFPTDAHPPNGTGEVMDAY